MSISRVGIMSGLLVVAQVAGVATIADTTVSAGSVNFASQAQQLADGSSASPKPFDSSLSDALISLQGGSQPVASVVSAFYDTYTSASTDFATSLTAAAAVYRQDVVADPAGAASAYLDNVNAARTAYVQRLDDARNQLESELRGEDQGDMERFVQQYDSASNRFDQQFTSVTRQIVSLQSNG